MNGPREKNGLEVAAVKGPPLYGNLELRDMYSVPLRGRITQATAGHTTYLHIIGRRKGSTILVKGG